MNTTKPHCSRCKKEKLLEQLNGYDPLATDDKKWLGAYCRDIINCNSDTAREIVADVINSLTTEGKGE